jgi:hypothetical protein
MGRPGHFSGFLCPLGGRGKFPFSIENLVFGPDGNLYVTGGIMTGPAGVFRFKGKTGDFIDLFAQTPGGLTPNDFAFGPDGNLYVVAAGGVIRFNGAKGTFIDNFVSFESGGLVDPYGLLFGLGVGITLGGYP